MPSSRDPDGPLGREVIAERDRCSPGPSNLNQRVREGKGTDTPTPRGIADHPREELRTEVPPVPMSIGHHPR